MSYKDSYTILDTELGCGQFGTVKYAQSNKEKGLNICVKLLKKQQSFGEHQYTTYQKTELDICKRMINKKYENLVQIYDVYDSDDEDEQAYIFMEKCDQNLKSLIEEKSKIQNFCFSQEQLLDIIIQITKGYISLKSEKIIHRDLKPENILLNIRNNKFTCKIADFGLSKVVIANSNNHMTIKIGTPYYQAPEILASKTYDDRCDIFSLGVIILELALLKRQFKVREIESLKEKTFSQVHSEVFKATTIDEDIVMLLDKMIVYDANNRLTWENLLEIVTQKYHKPSLSISNIISSKQQENSHSINPNSQPFQDKQFNNQKPVLPQSQPIQKGQQRLQTCTVGKQNPQPLFQNNNVICQNQLAFQFQANINEKQNFPYSNSYNTQQQEQLLNNQNPPQQVFLNPNSIKTFNFQKQNIDSKFPISQQCQDKQFNNHTPVQPQSQPIQKGQQRFQTCIANQNNSQQTSQQQTQQNLTFLLQNNNQPQQQQKTNYNPQFVQNTPLQFFQFNQQQIQQTNPQNTFTAGNQKQSSLQPASQQSQSASNQLGTVNGLKQQQPYHLNQPFIAQKHQILNNGYPGMPQIQPQNNNQGFYKYKSEQGQQNQQ